MEVEEVEVVEEVIHIQGPMAAEEEGEEVSPLVTEHLHQAAMVHLLRAATVHRLQVAMGHLH